MPHRKVDIVPEKGKKRAHQPPRPWQHSEISVGSHAVTAQARSVRDREERKSAWTWAHGSKHPVLFMSMPGPACLLPCLGKEESLVSRTRTTPLRVGKKGAETSAGHQAPKPSAA